MIQGLTRAGLGAVAGEAELVALAGKHGFGAVDTDARKLIAELGAEDAKAWLSKHGIQFGSFGLVPQWRTTEEEFRAGLPALVESAAAAAELGGQVCCTYILPSTDANPAHFMVLATRRLRTCARILGEYGIRLGLEFVGPHHLRTRWKHLFIWTMRETLDWAEAIGEPNVGLLLDAYHWYTNEDSVDSLLALRPSDIVHVHINDAPNVPVSEALDNGRLYPGEGVIDLPGFLGALRRIGYTGVVAQEILTQQPPTDAPDTLAARSRAGFDKVFAAVR